MLGWTFAALHMSTIGTKRTYLLAPIHVRFFKVKRTWDAAQHRSPVQKRSSLCGLMIQ